jgi:hypothetical protein
MMKQRIHEIQPIHFMGNGFRQHRLNFTKIKIGAINYNQIKLLKKGKHALVFLL